MNEGRGSNDAADACAYHPMPPPMAAPPPAMELARDSAMMTLLFPVLGGTTDNPWFTKKTGNPLTVTLNEKTTVHVLSEPRAKDAGKGYEFAD